MGKETIFILLVVGAGAVVLLSRPSMGVGSPFGPAAGGGGPSNDLAVGAQVASSFMPTWQQTQSLIGQFGSGASGQATADGSGGF